MKRRTHKPKTSVENWTVSQVGCPDCAGVLKLTRDGRHGHHRYKCYVGHRFSTQSLLKAKEAQLENALWSTLVLLAHIEMVCSNLIRERQSARASASSIRIAPRRSPAAGPSTSTSRPKTAR